MNSLIQSKSFDLSTLDNIYKAIPENTRKAYIKNINQFLDYLKIGINEIIKVTYKNIIDYIDYLKTKYKNSSINQKISSLKSLFNRISVIYNIDNPFDILKRLNIKTTQKTDLYFNSDLSLTSKEIKDLLKHYENKSKSDNFRTQYTCKRNYILISLLYYSGLRISETLNIKYSDINKVNNYYTINIIGKGNKPRIIKIDRELFNRITDLHKDGYIFRGLNNKQLSRLSICQDIKRLAKRLLNKDIHLHIFRHSFATNLIDITKDISKVSKYLGHSDINITSKYYYHNSLSFNELNLLKT